MSPEGIDAEGARLDVAVREQVLEQAREVGDKALERLRGVAEQLPQGALDHVERLHQGPTAERRKAARLSDGAIPVAVHWEAIPNGAGGAVRDHCPTGLAVLLPCPAGVGTLLHVRIPPEMGDIGWVSVEVRYCRKEKGGWVAGCELVSNQPPI
jgi:hypothetical protein